MILNGVSTFTGIDLADVDRKFMEYLAENGWEGAVGEKNVEDFESFDSTRDSGEAEKE